MSTPTPRTDSEEYPEGEGQSFHVVSADFARTLERELAIERTKVETLREAMKYLCNDDNYIDPQFDPCELASTALAATEDKQ